MNEQIKKTFEPLKQFWSNTSKTVKRVVIGGLIVTIIVALALSILMNSKEYVVIFDDLSETETSEILAKLQDMDVSVKADGSSIMVLKEEESSVRMALATEGYPKSGLSYYLIEQNNGMLTTDYERKQYVNMQLQERIAASIKTLDGVKDAVVTITVPDEEVFYLQEKEEPTASVIIHMKQGCTLSKGQITGIQNLVAKSVSGLKKENIALSDSLGNDLVGDSTNNVSLTKIGITREIENDIKKKVNAVLLGPYNGSQFKVSVTATVDTDDMVKEETLYIPSPDGDNTGVISEQDKSEESSSSTQADGGVPGTSSNSEVPTYPTGGNSGQSTSTGSKESIKYKVSQTKSQTQKSGAKIEKISIGIAIDKASFEPGERESVTQLVAFAAGVSPEAISVQNFQFYEEETTGTDEAKSGINKMLLYGGIGGGLLLLIGGLAAFMMMKKRKQAQALAAVVAEGEAVNTEGALNEIFGETVEKVTVPHITPIQDVKRDEIKEFAKSNPEIAAQMIKSWLRSENDDK